MTSTLEELDAAVAYSDQHHHFYHYKASYLHLCYAEFLRAQGRLEEARKQYEAAWFQDHQNGWAVGWESRESPHEYQAHITSGAIEKLAAFEASLGLAADSSMALCAAEKFEEALAECARRHEHYHHHASGVHVARGDYYMACGEADLALADYSKALDLWRKNPDASAKLADCQAKRVMRGEE